MTNLNYTVFTGNLTSDAEVKTTSTGKSFLVFAVAVNKSYKDGENWKTITTYINHIAWFSKYAEQRAKKLTKGTKVTVQAHLINNNFEKDGKKFSLLEVRADDIEIVKFAGAKSENEEDFDVPSDTQESEKTNSLDEEKVDWEIY